MYDPIMRVLTVLEILQARERVSGSELAERLEVSPRTVQRYIARLQDLCIPVESARGVDGCYWLKPGFRLPPLMFTDEEAFAVALGLRALRQIGLSAFAPAAEGAYAKLGRVLPEALRESAQSVEDVVAIETGPWVVKTSPESLMGASTAIRMRKRVSFAYATHAGAQTRRELEPYGLMHMDGRWYLVGRCLLRQAMRTFRLDRVSELQALEIGFERPADFDTKQYLENGMPFVESQYQVDVWLDLPAAEARKHFALHRVSLQDENGGTAIRCGRDSLDLFAVMLLSVGCPIVVRGPAELKQAFTRVSERAASAAQ